MAPFVNGGKRAARDGAGRFLPGGVGGPGRPAGGGAASARLRRLMHEAVADDDIRAIVRGMVEAAKGGDMAAAREILDRLVGKPLDSAALAALDRLEEIELAQGEYEHRFAELLRVSRIDGDAAEG